MAGLIKAGNLNRRITIEQYTSALNAYGESLITWAPVTTVWAQLRQAKGTENVEAAQLTAVSDKIFWIRYRTGLNEKMRVLYDSQYYDIKEINEVGTREGLEIRAVSGAKT
jgi:SPP1 family predicted phage head-tail adaptor